MNRQQENRQTLERMARLEDMLTLTREVERSVEEGDWETASKLEARRRPLVDEFFTVKPGIEEEDRVREVLRDMLEITNRVIGLASHIRHGIQMRASTVNTGRKAVRAYARSGA